MFSRNYKVKAGQDEKKSSDLKGLLILASFALMNVQDINGDPRVELIPFLKYLLDDEDFADGLHKMSILLFGTALNPVSHHFLVFVLVLFFPSEIHSHI